LPAGCTAPQADAERTAGNQFRGGQWAALPLQHNPQTSSEPTLIVAVRERLGGVPLLPDAPALTPRDAARFRLPLADGIEEAYAATYRQTDSDEMVVVYGLRFPDARAAAEFWSSARAAKSPGITAVMSDAIIAVVSGRDGVCRDAVAAHVLSLR
jgi:hypothetical protein